MRLRPASAAAAEKPSNVRVTPGSPSEPVVNVTCGPEQVRQDRGGRGADGAVSRGVRGERGRHQQRGPVRVGLGRGIAVGVRLADRRDRPPEVVRILGIPAGDHTRRPWRCSAGRTGGRSPTSEFPRCWATPSAIEFQWPGGPPCRRRRPRTGRSRSARPCAGGAVDAAPPRSLTSLNAVAYSTLVKRRGRGRAELRAARSWRTGSRAATGGAGPRRRRAGSAATSPGRGSAYR